MTAARTPERVVRVRLIAGRSERDAWEFVPGRSTESIDLGTDPGCDWCLDAPGVAPRHARLAFDGTSLWLTSVAAGGVLVDGGAVGDDWVEVRVGSALSLGAVVLCAEASSERGPGLPGRATEPAQGALPGAEDTVLVAAPAEVTLTEVPSEATHVELPLPSGERRAAPRAPSPQLGAAASGAWPASVAASGAWPASVAPAQRAPVDAPYSVGAPGSVEATRPIESPRPREAAQKLGPLTGGTTLRVALAVACVALVSCVTLAIGAWRWLARDEPQSLATTPEAALLPPALPPPLPAGRHPEALPLAPPPLPGEGSELSRAVALLAEGRVAEAALAYEALARAHPERPELAIAARALRARAQGGAP